LVWTFFIWVGDAATDIAILKVEGNDFSTLSLAASSAVKTGDKICTIGYPNIQMQGQDPKYTEGVISSLSGPGDNGKCGKGAKSEKSLKVDGMDIMD